MKEPIASQLRREQYKRDAAVVKQFLVGLTMALGGVYILTSSWKQTLAIGFIFIGLLVIVAGTRK